MDVLKSLFGSHHSHHHTHATSVPPTPATPGYSSGVSATSIPPTPNMSQHGTSVASTPQRSGVSATSVPPTPSQPITLQPGDMPFDPRKMQEALDEALAFDLYMKQFGAIETKKNIAKEDEESAFKLQLGGGQEYEQGKQLYVKYPALDAIKGDEAFFPLGAVLDKKQSVLPAPMVPTQSKMPNYAAPNTAPPPSSLPSWKAQPPVPNTPDPARSSMQSAGLVVRRGDASALYGSSVSSNVSNASSTAPSIPPTPATPQPTDHWEAFARQRDEERARLLLPPPGFGCVVPDSPCPESHTLRPPSTASITVSVANIVGTPSQPPSVPPTQTETRTMPGTPNAVLPYTITETVTTTVPPTPATPSYASALSATAKPFVPQSQQ